MEYVTATNLEFVELFKGLEAVKNVKGTRFAFIVAKNLKELNRYLTPFEKQAIPTKAFQEVAAKAHELAEAENAEGIKKLEEENAELIKERKAQLAAIEQMMQEEAVVALELIREDQLPEDLSTDQLLPLLRMIKS